MQNLELITEAVEALRFYANIESWSTMDDHSTYTNLENDKDMGTGDFYVENSNTDDNKVSGARARRFLARFSHETSNTLLEM